MLSSIFSAISSTTVDVNFSYVVYRTIVQITIGINRDRSILVGITVGIVFLGQVAVLGMVIFASIGGNEPLITKEISQPDQVTSFFRPSVRPFVRSFVHSFVHSLT
jgi:hypothetical protein